MKTLFTITSTVLSLLCSAQQFDYREARDTICPKICGWRDSLSLTEIIPKMLALDTNMLTPDSRYSFFNDLSHQEYMLYGYTLDTALMRSNAVHCTMAAHHNPKAYGTYWNAAFAFYKLGECINMLYWLGLYEERTPRKYLDKKQRQDIVYLKESCK